MASASEPQLNRWLVALMASCGISVLALSIAAESTRAKSYTYLMDFEQHFHCNYPTSAASVMAFVAAALLVLPLGLATYLTGSTMCMRGPRYYVGRLNLVSNIIFVFAWIFFTISFILLIVGGVENEYHTQETTGGFTELRCSIVRGGTFAAAGVFGFLCIGLAIAYYAIGVMIRLEVWRTAGGYSSPTLEAEIGQWPKRGSSALPPVPEEAP